MFRHALIRSQSKEWRLIYDTDLCLILSLIDKFLFFFFFAFQFYADLHQLSKAHSQAVSLVKQAQMDPLLRNNVKLILKATRPLSFC